MKRFYIIVLGLPLGVGMGYMIVLFPINFSAVKSPIPDSTTDVNLTRKQVVGFFPYWLLEKAQSDYSAYITQLSLFDN